jgi:hypothetical protein
MTRKDRAKKNTPNAHISVSDKLSVSEKRSSIEQRNTEHLREHLREHLHGTSGKNAPKPTPVPPAKTRQPWNYKSWASSLSSLLLLMGIGTAITGTGYLSLQFLLNPRSVIWVNNYLPEPLQVKVAGWDQPRTMKELTADLKKSELWFGEQIRLSAANQADFVVPVFQNRDDCTDACQQIVELRVYRSVAHPYHKTKEQHYQMVSQLSVLGMEDWFVQEPFVNAQVDVPPPSAAILGFNSVELLSDQAPKEGIWLTLKGERDQIGTYGQVLHYNPGKSSLTAMMPWTSPAREMPHWENIALGGSPELVVNQTIGLDPLYQIYLLEPDRGNLSGLKLRNLSLTKPVLEARSYLDALKLAKVGLWSLALESINALGEDTLKSNTTAQLQRDVIKYHAQIFKAQSEQPSANTSQQVLADLMDGRWEKAIKAVKATPGDREEVIELLNADSGQLLKRLAAALEIQPGNPALQSWNAAMKMARGGKGSAIAWLKTQPTQPSGGDRSKMLADIAPSLNPTPKPTISPTPVSRPSSIPTPIPSPAILPSPAAIPVRDNQTEIAPRSVEPKKSETTQ